MSFLSSEAAALRIQQAYRSKRLRDDFFTSRLMNVLDAHNNIAVTKLQAYWRFVVEEKLFLLKVYILASKASLR